MFDIVLYYKVTIYWKKSYQVVGVEAFDGNKPINYLKSLIFGLIINYECSFRKKNKLSTATLEKRYPSHYRNIKEVGLQSTIAE